MPPTKKHKIVTNIGPLILFNTADITYVLRDKRKLTRWMLDAIHSESAIPGPVNFIFCSDNYLQQLNESYLHHFDLTDIITFDYSEHSGNIRTVSGDIFISLDRVRENARIFKVNVSHEIHRVMIHGILHLCGYKDKNPSQKKIMTAREDFYLSQF